ncbi:MAG: hypothetical protein AUI15_25010 [Actinobacteria bacterium 13_2_20CM_2_66_6]|nr:MAG: hypothetical protein AUI15_25010 [Actinobacteria bacterium 13_2_20CM_2_66_6]
MIAFCVLMSPATLTWPPVQLRLVAVTAAVDPGSAMATAYRLTVVLVFPTAAPNEIGSASVRTTSTCRWWAW